MSGHRTVTHDATTVPRCSGPARKASRRPGGRREPSHGLPGRRRRGNR
ncbi:hypothetical protein SUDANB176_01137 [Streptomyces sp. enrichment culture]